ncbi:MAG TPA: FAD-dependent oxidoreductase [Candidatus Acidoferrum sp.]|nr:FAD-dependent oxidoreductase [Candidatus Acidoferrum sp.]
MVTVDELGALAIIRDLPHERLAHVAERAADLRPVDGDYVIYEGEVAAFFIVLEGLLEITKRIGGVEHVLSERRPGEYFGEVPLMLGATAFANARARGAARVARIDAVIFREMLQESATLSTAVARSMSERVGDIVRISRDFPAATATIVGVRFDEACHELRDFLARNQVAFDWFDPVDPTITHSMPEVVPFLYQCPLVRLNDGRVLVRPSKRELACELGLRIDPLGRAYDVVVVGGGPAGLAAAVYGASEGLATLIVEREAPGGQAGTSSRIENYLGFPSGLSGDDLGARAFQQAKRLGAEVVVTRNVVALRPGEAHGVELDGEQIVQARAIVLATGVAWRTLPVPNIERFTGRGVYYGAARSEAPTTNGKDVYCVGGGNSAGQAAVFFSDYARSVTLLVRGASLVHSMSAYLIEQLARKPKMRIELHSEIVAVEGDDHLRAIVVRGPGGESRRETDSVFVFIGADAQTGWLPDTIVRDNRGYVLTGLDVAHRPEVTWPLERDPFLLETSVPTIFASGDVRHGSVKRVASAVGEGSMAIAFVHQALTAEQPAPV